MGDPEPILPLSIVNKNRFLDLFYEPSSVEISKKTALHLHIMRIDGGDFDLAKLYKELSNSTLGYVLSRQNLERLQGDLGRTVEFVNKVQDQFKPPDPLNGEGGELLLYAFLEAHLGAPKILSKMELKTSPNDYIKGADGVHLLDSGDNEYQLIFGESKMYGDGKGKPESSVKHAIKAAFTSMVKVREGLFDFDTWLVESELLKEQADPEKVKLLASIILPSAKNRVLSKTNAFGVFIGYEVDVTGDRFEDLTTQEIEALVRERAERLVTDQIELIRKQISDNSLGGYHFHFYAVPFMKTLAKGQTRGIENVRIELASALGHDQGARS